MKDNFFKSWKTTLLGLTILGLFVHGILSAGKEFEISDAANLIPLLSALGFIFTKDATTSHSKGNRGIEGQPPIDGPDPKKEEK